MAALEHPFLSFLPAERLLSHEEVVEERVEELIAALRADGVVRRAVVADKDSLVVLDGHHRLTALRRLGCKRVPVLLVDYRDPGVRLGTWREGEEPPSKEQVVRHARSGKLYPPKTTRHLFPWRLHEDPVRLADLM